MNYFDDIKFIVTGRHREYGSFMKNYVPPGTFSLEFTRKGKLWFQQKGRKKVLLKAPFVYWLQPLKEYSYGCPPGETRDHSYITFKGLRAERIMKYALIPLSSKSYCYIRRPLEFGDLFDRIIDIILNHYPEKHYEAAAIMEQIVAMLIEGKNVNQSEDEKSHPIIQFAENIKKDPFADINFREIVPKKLFMSYSNFHRVFKKLLNQSPYDFLLTYRIQEAARIFREEKEVQVQEVAMRCGCSDPPAFSKLFKKKIGMSPSEYISHLRQV